MVRITMDDAARNKEDVGLGDTPTYIRTFHRDAAAVQRGEHPDLALLSGEESAPSSVPAASATELKGAPPSATDTSTYFGAATNAFFSQSDSAEDAVPQTETAVRVSEAPPTPLDAQSTEDDIQDALQHVRSFQKDVGAYFSGHPEERPRPAEKPLSPEDRAVVLQERFVSEETPQPSSKEESRESVLARLREKVSVRKNAPEPVPEPRVSKDDAQKEETLARLRARVEEMRAAGDIAETRPKAPAIEAAPVAVMDQAPMAGQAPALARDESATLHTYGSDFSSYADATGASAVSILASQADAARPVASSSTVFSRRSKVLLAISGVFIFGSLASAFFVVEYRLRNPESVPPAAQVEIPLFVDERTALSPGYALADAIFESVAMPLPVPGVRILYLTNGTTTQTDLFSALALPAPAVLLRNLDSKNSVGGIVRSGTGTHPFFILRTLSYRDTFSSMLAWEPRMARDLAALFPPPPATLPVSTSTPSVSFASFTDKVVANHDARVYRGETGESILLYGYADPRTLIIARDEAAFAELVRRIGGSQTTR